MSEATTTLGTTPAAGAVTQASGATQQPAAAQAPAATEPTLTAAEAMVELKRVRAEAAEARTALRDAKKIADDNKKALDLAALDKATSEGNWKEVVRLSGEAEKVARAEADSFKAKAIELEPYRATVSAEVEALKTKLGDKAALVASLSPAQALPILRELAGQAAAAGPGAARVSTNGQPAATAQTKPLEMMTQDEVDAHLRTLPTKDLLNLDAKYNGRKQSKRLFEA